MSMTLLQQNQPTGEGLVETATLPLSPVHVVLERSYEGSEEVACVLTAKWAVRSYTVGIDAP